MNIEIEQGDKSALIRLSGELTIYTVAEIKARLAQVMAEAHTLEVDLAEVTDMDTAGLQLMLIAKRRVGKTVSFVNHSPVVLRFVDLANLGGVLGDLMVVEAAQV